MKLSSIFSDGMVLQRNEKVVISGVTKPTYPVRLTFLGKLYESISNSHGNFSIELDKLDPGGPHQMEIVADEIITIKDILIGDVWVLGGQSNMELPLNRTQDLFAREIKEINQPFIRQFIVPQEYDFHAPKKSFSSGNWINATQNDVMNFSAVGYFFAQKIHEKYGVPIGLIYSAVGGTPIEAWISEKTLRQFNRYDDLLDQNKDDSYVHSMIQNDENRNNLWYQHLNEKDQGLQEKWYEDVFRPLDWNEFEVPNSWQGTELENIRGSVWFTKEFEVTTTIESNEALLKLGTIVDADDTYINGTCIGTTGYRYPPRRYTVPGGLLRPGKNTITVRVISTQTTGEFIKGMPYQLIVKDKEINLEGTWKYKLGALTESLQPQTFFRNYPAGLYNGMIAPLSNYRINGILWYQGESNTAQPHGYNTLFNQLVSDWRKNWNQGEIPFLFTQLANLDTGDSNNNWAVLREEQRKGLSVPHTAMAVTIDIGEYNDLHPQDKKTLGARLALAALNKAYDEDIVYSGPLYKKMERIGNTIHLTFDHIGSGLTIRDGDEVLKTFTICGSDGKFIPATALIRNNQIIVSHETMQEPQHVRYGWSDNPEDANLYNKEGLPASPFTTE